MFPQQTARNEISIHALREEGDSGTSRPDTRYNISIHALREEGDVSICPPASSIIRFLSTPSARRATVGESRNKT